MQRPVMHPQYLSESESEKPAGRKKFVHVRRAFKMATRVLLTELFFWRSSGQIKIEDAPPLVRFLRGVLYRMAFVPIFVVLVVIAIVYSTTHPPTTSARLDPGAQGIYFDPVEFTASDGVKLSGWVVPVVDARKVLQQREMALVKKQPGVVLVHDYAANREQMLPLVRPLHEAGIIVMVVSLRGSANQFVGQTFGFNESLDVSAAIETLRKQPMIDPDRIGLLGTGSGATAALLASQRDPASVRAMVLHNPIQTAEEVVDRLGPSELWLKWLDPLCKWTFELSYKVDVNDLSTDHLAKALEGKSVMTLRTTSANAAGTLSRRSIQQVTAYLADKLAPGAKVAELPKN